MFEIDRAYISIALLLALAGMLQGFYMGLAADNRFVPLHTALLLPGFVTMAIYGALFRLWPAMKKAPLATAQFWISMIGIAGIIVGSYLFVANGSVPVVAVGGIAAIVAAAMMIWLFWSASGETA